MLNYIIISFKLLFLTIIQLIIFILSSIFNKKQCPIIVKIYYKILYFSLGLNTPIIRDLRKNKKNPKIIVYQHNSYFDPFILYEHFNNISPIAGDQYKKHIFMGQFLKNLNCIFTKKGETVTKIKQIVNFTNNTVMIAPDSGLNTKDNFFGEFKTGAFICLKPVTPVLFVYSSPSEESDAIWRNDDNFISWFKRKIMTNEYVDVKVYILDEICPKKWHDPKSFAKYTKNIMKEMYEKLKNY